MVLSADFGPRSHRAPKVHRASTGSAAARAPNCYGGSGHGQSSVSGIQGRTSTRIGAASDVEGGVGALSSTFGHLRFVREHSCQSQRRLTAKALSFGGGCLGTLLRVCVCVHPHAGVGGGGILDQCPRRFLSAFSRLYCTGLVCPPSLFLCAAPPLCVAFLPGLPAMWAGGC
eukprot:COSAG06_NODE_363_length_16808_cov_11.122509_9_plen_172_part_00